MKFRILFELLGGIVGFLFLIASIISFSIGEINKAFILDFFTLITLSPYMTINSYREKTGQVDSLSSAWKGKFGSLLHLCNIFNLFWLGFLIYQVTDSFIYPVLSVVFQFLILPRLVLIGYNWNKF